MHLIFFATDGRRTIVSPYPQIIDGTWYRDVDSETKIIEHIATKILPNDSRTLYLYTEREPCISCDNVFVQFSKKFPHINMFIYFDEEYAFYT